jgi:hypothetical protein
MITRYRTLDGKLLAVVKAGETLDGNAFHEALAAGGAAEAEQARQSARPQRRPAIPGEPDAMEMATNFGKAMGGWVAAGFPVVTQAQYDQRGTICEACSYWDGSANVGLGKCKAPGCGCTKFKRWLATETCKHPQGSRWPALKPA